MKSCRKVEIVIPAESLVAWLRTRFPELPEDTSLVGAYTSAYLSGASTVKLTLEHSFEEDKEGE